MGTVLTKDSRILIVGHNDSLERSLAAHFRSQGQTQVFSSSAMGVDVTNQKIAEDFFAQHKPEYVFLSSTRSGGIMANQQNPGEFIYHNLASAMNILFLANKCRVKKLVFLASSCVYPAQCRQPIQEKALLTGPLEASNEPYSVAKIAGIKLCQAFRQQYGLNAIVMVPATLYGPGEVADLEKSHVLGALIHKFYQAVKTGQNEVSVWGSGRPRREFLYIDDFIQAVLYLLDEYNGGDIINAGTGKDVTIKDLATMVARISGFKGRIVFDRSKPDGTMRKLLDSRCINMLGWKAKVSLEEGIRQTYEWYRQSHAINA